MRRVNTPTNPTNTPTAQHSKTRRAVQHGQGRISPVPSPHRLRGAWVGLSQTASTGCAAPATRDHSSLVTALPSKQPHHRRLRPFPYLRLGVACHELGRVPDVDRAVSHASGDETARVLGLLGGHLGPRQRREASPENRRTRNETGTRREDG